MLNLKKLLNKLVRSSVQIGTQIALGQITLSSGGYYSFSLGTSCPQGAIVISYIVYFSNAYGGTFSVPSYGADRTQYVVGTANATITNLKVTPIYIMP